MTKQKTHEEFLNDLSIKNPWYLSGEFKVIGTYVNSSTKIECHCHKHGPFYATPNSLLRPRGCPLCGNERKIENRTGKTARKTTEEFLADLSIKNQKYRRNEFEVKGDYISSKIPIQCQCPIHGEFNAIPNKLLTRSQGCPKCNSSHKKTHEEFVDEMSITQPNIEIIGKYISSRKKIKVRCRKCRNEWLVKPNSMQQGTGCPKCSRTSTSRMEQFVCAFFEQIFGKDQVMNRDRSLIGMELDIVCQNYAWELGSWHWHKAGRKQKTDRIKEIRCLEKGIKLTVIYDSCPTERPPELPNDVQCFDFDLWSDKGHKTLKRLCLQWASEMGQSLCEKDVDWHLIELSANERTRALSPQEFGDRLASINPNIEIIGEYTSMTSRVNVRCLVCGNIWHPRAYSMLQGHGCPKCSQRERVLNRRGKTAKKDTESFLKDLKTRNTHYYNGEFKILSEYTLSNEPVECQCNICGTKWSVNASSLISSGSGCPRCEHRKGARMSSGSKRLNPNAFQDRVRELQPSLTLLTDYVEARQKVLVQCNKCGYIWRASPISLSRGSGCPACSNKVVFKGYNDLKTTHPELAKEWHPTKNEDLKADEIIAGSTRKVWWLGRCGHEWQAQICERKRGSGCPICAKKRKKK